MSIRILHPRECSALTPETWRLVAVYLGIQPHSDSALERSLEGAMILSQAEGVPVGVDTFRTLFSRGGAPVPGLAPWDEEGDGVYLSTTRWAS